MRKILDRRLCYVESCRYWLIQQKLKFRVWGGGGWLGTGLVWPPSVAPALMYYIVINKCYNRHFRTNVNYFRLRNIIIHWEPCVIRDNRR